MCAEHVRYGRLLDLAREEVRMMHLAPASPFPVRHWIELLDEALPAASRIASL